MCLHNIRSLYHLTVYGKNMITFTNLVSDKCFLFHPVSLSSWMEIASQVFQWEETLNKSIKYFIFLRKLSDNSLPEKSLDVVKFNRYTGAPFVNVTIYPQYNTNKIVKFFKIVVFDFYLLFRNLFFSGLICVSEVRVFQEIQSSMLCKLCDYFLYVCMSIYIYIYIFCIFWLK
jgi:hypothetical protein